MAYFLSLLYLRKDYGLVVLASLGMTTGVCKILQGLIMPYCPGFGNDVIRASKFTKN